MSNTALLRRYAAVSPFPIVVAFPPINAEATDAARQWTYELLSGFGEFDYMELPPDAAAAIISLDKARTKKLERETESKLTFEQIADLFHFAKLIDAVRLAGDRETRKLCLLALENAHGPTARMFMEEAFESRGITAREVLHSHLRWICFASRLGLVFPNESDTPRVAIVAPNLFEAVRMQIVLSLHQSYAAAHCEQCGNSYVRHTQEQKFCSQRCASRERQARFRARSKGRKTK